MDPELGEPIVEEMQVQYCTVQNGQYSTHTGPYNTHTGPYNTQWILQYRLHRFNLANECENTKRSIVRNRFNPLSLRSGFLFWLTAAKNQQKFVYAISSSLADNMCKLKNLCAAYM